MEALVIFRTKWLYIIGMVLFLPLLGGCQESGIPDKVRTVDDAYAVIVGEWEWTRTYMIGRLGTVIQTPETEGITKQYFFKRDRTMRIIENRILVRESEYRIEAYENSFGLQIMETGTRLVMSFRSDTLILSNPAFGDANYFLRK